MAYYVLLQQGTPAELIPIVHLKKHYEEALRECLRNTDHEAPHEGRDESDISMLSTENFEAMTARGIVVVDFMTHWCGPCKEMTLDLEKLARDYKETLKVGRLNVDRNRDVAHKFHTKGFPTLVMLENGRELARLRESHPYAELKAWVDRVLQGRIRPETSGD
jgi:thioredoxin